MKCKEMKRDVVAVAVASVLTGSVGLVHAGQIVSDAPEGEALETAVSSTNKQFGFGGWNLDNVDVSIVNTIDSAPTDGTFDSSNGTYSAMHLFESFESSLKSGGEVRGHLHGKDWPVGEPSGVKVLNGDLATKQGRPQNCIMTSSYLESGYLGAGNKPTLCSSGFQTHKRFKINMLPSMVANTSSGDGLPVEMIFNLVADDSSTQRYQVFQKLNNYTDKRLDGYKIEVLDESGSFNPALTVSLGIGESPNNDGTAGDIWDTESKANFSHGLWGPVDNHFDEPGFFDDRRVYYTPTLSSDRQIISYQGAILGGNYQALFGDWLPSIWEPQGIFHDDDMNPETDNTLRAFWGDPLNTGSNAWHTGNSSNWETATEEDLLRWTGEWYGQSAIEDVLNLGVNYIVNVGDNSSIGNKFTIRITPHIASDQSQPAYVSNPPTSAPYTESEGIIVIEVQLVPGETTEETTSPDDEIVTDGSLIEMRSKVEESDTVINQSAIITVGVADGDLNTDPAIAETVEVMVTSDHGEVEMVTLTESGPNTGRFVGTLQAEVGNNEMLDNDGKFNLNMVTNLRASYVDNKYGEQSGPQTLEASLNVDIASTPDVDDDDDTPGVDDDDDTPGVDDDDDTPGVDDDDDTPGVDDDDDTPDVDDDDDTPGVDDDDDTPDVDDDDDTPVVDDDNSVVVDDAPVVVDDELVSVGGSGSTFDAQSDASLMLMLLGFLGVGGFVTRRKLDTTEK